jgi:hypothetical protein
MNKRLIKVPIIEPVRCEHKPLDWHKYGCYPCWVSKVGHKPPYKVMLAHEDAV